MGLGFKIKKMMSLEFRNKQKNQCLKFEFAIFFSSVMELQDPN